MSRVFALVSTGQSGAPEDGYPLTAPAIVPPSIEATHREAMPPAASEPEPVAEVPPLNFDGRWIGKTGEYMGSIVGTTITWADGPGVELRKESERVISCELFGDIFRAELNAEGQLVWSDGDIWVRESAVDGNEA